MRTFLLLIFSVICLLQTPFPRVAASNPNEVDAHPPTARADRVLTTNDLPRSEFRSERYNERLTILRYQAQQADKGNPQALYAMGIRYLYGIDVPRHEKTAREYLQAAKRRGSLRARAKLEELSRLQRTQRQER